MSSLKREIFAFLLGILFGGFFSYSFIPGRLDHDHSENADDKYHIHADFLIQVEDNTIDFGQAELMTTATNERHKHAHLHDDEGEVLHMHEENITFVEFLNSLDVELSESCLTVQKEEFCTNDNKSIKLYVNDEMWGGAIKDYVPKDLDRILLFYGTESTPLTQTYLDKVSDEACLYSGSCPERGIAPPESCGLTCEL